METVNIGISQEDRKKTAEGLARFLADSYTLYLKTHKFHWNVQGPQFNSLHLMFENQYVDLAAAVDEIAERIRALGEMSPGSYREFAELSTISEEDGHLNSQDMLKSLLAGHEQVVQTARSVFPAAEKASDETTADLLTQRMHVHEKTAWMLRSMLAKD